MPAAPASAPPPRTQVRLTLAGRTHPSQRSTWMSVQLDRPKLTAFLTDISALVMMANRCTQRDGSHDTTIRVGKWPSQAGDTGR